MIKKTTKVSTKFKPTWRQRNPSRARNLQYKYYYNNYIKTIPNTREGLLECQQVHQWFKQRHQRDMQATHHL